MKKIDAMDVWDKVCQSNWCQKAYGFCRQNGLNKLNLLEQGGADFDQTLGLPGEQPWYRAAYYAGRDLNAPLNDYNHKGYMDMHILQNRVAFNQHLRPNFFRKRNTCSLTLDVAR